jgi:hypothetical protein
MDRYIKNEMTCDPNTNLSLENMIGESWREVPGYMGRLQASNLGRIKQLPYITSSNYEVPAKIKVIGQRKYATVAVHIKRKTIALYVHRLVAAAFINNPLNKPMVNHKDANKLNNHIDNLEWCTSKENIQHAAKNNLLNTANGTRSARSKLTEVEVLKIRSMLRDGLIGSLIHKKHFPHISLKNIYEIKNRKTWKHI